MRTGCAVGLAVGLPSRRALAWSRAVALALAPLAVEAAQAQMFDVCGELSHELGRSGGGTEEAAEVARGPRPSGQPEWAPPKSLFLQSVRYKARAKRFSPRTERVYVAWIRRFIRFHGLWSSWVAPATQAQALCALLFLIRGGAGATAGPAGRAAVGPEAGAAAGGPDGGGGGGSPPGTERGTVDGVHVALGERVAVSGKAER